MGRKLINLTNKTFGTWLVLQHHDINYNGLHRWLCQCSCGKKKVIYGFTLRGKISKSCGHIRNHGHTTNGKSPTYNSWDGMIQRCTNPNEDQYQDYGGRGIKVCKRWRDFRKFLLDMGERPKGMSLDRKNVQGNYSPINCKWSTSKEQAKNKRSVMAIESFPTAVLLKELRRRRVFQKNGEKK